MERYPASLCPPKRLTAPFLKPMVQLGPVAFGGGQQRGAPDAGWWTMKLTVDLYHEPQVLAFRGFVTAIQGGLEPFTIGVFDDRHAPAPAGRPATSGGITHSDGSLHSDGAGYSQSNIEIVAAETIEDGATSLTAAVTVAGPLRRGMFFSLADRLYQVTSHPEETSPGVWAFRFLPPAREEAAAGATLEFARPICRMTFADPMTGQMDVTPPYLAEATLDLEEAGVGF